MQGQEFLGIWVAENPQSARSVAPQGGFRCMSKIMTIWLLLVKYWTEQRHECGVLLETKKDRKK